MVRGCSTASKSYWGEMLGLNDFYYELAVQAVELCLRHRGRTGDELDGDDEG